MKDEGWTFWDLGGELWVRGIDINDLSVEEIQSVLDEPRPEKAAQKLQEQ